MEGCHVIGAYGLHLTPIGVPTRCLHAVSMSRIEEEEEIAFDDALVIDEVIGECGQDVVSGSRLVEQRTDVLGWDCEGALGEIMAKVLCVIDTTV